MSSRAFRRLHRDADIIRLRITQDEEEESKDNDLPVISQAQRKGKKKGFVQPVLNPFDVLLDDDASEEEGNEQNQSETMISHQDSFSPSQKKKKKKKQRRKKRDGDTTTSCNSESTERDGEDEVDVAIKEVSDMLGGLETSGSMKEVKQPNATLRFTRPLLCVDRRCLNADNEMRRIFGSRVVRAEQNQRRGYKRKPQKATIMATPKDTWPQMEKLGLSMQMVEFSKGCQYFVFEHGTEYQKVQFSFWDAVETYDPNAIGAVLHAHPYHIDSLLQLSEVCKMGDDSQMAADLIERSLYCFECSFHPLFNYTQDNCRLSYNRAENRSFFLTLFHHLGFVGLKGCHRTAFEFCKLLLSLDPDNDPLCVLLMIDYYALRGCEYKFLIDLFNAWEGHKNLSQLPNFAFSVPLAMFFCAGDGGIDKGEETEEDGSGDMLESSCQKLQEALIMFPSLLLLLLDKCGVTLDSSITNHSHFTCRLAAKDPDALQLLIKMYVERAHSLWKVPEVLKWLEDNAKVVTNRADANDALIPECAKKRQRRYIGTPNNVYRHVIVSELENVTASLPREVTNTPIMMYDPLPPEDSTSGYSRPPRSQLNSEDAENPFSLFLRSLLPSYSTGQGGPAIDPRHPGMPLHQVPQPARAEAFPEGAVGGERTGFALEQALSQLSQSLQGLLDQLRTAVNTASNEQEGNSEQDVADSDSDDS